jgi:hyperosmotically inducible protein
MRKYITVAVFLALSAAGYAQVSSNGPVIADYGKKITAEDPVEAKIAKEVRHELLMLPWYSLFDDLEFSVQGRTVTLSGYVSGQHAGTKSDAENTVKQIEGVDKVINNIKVLPPSPLDDQVREQTYAALSRTGSLSRYFWEAAPSIHIIVDNQRVTLVGIVNSEGDKNLATIAANTVPGVFQVTNELRVVK